jgi:hypothetical protein
MYLPGTYAPRARSAAECETPSLLMAPTSVMAPNTPPPRFSTIPFHYHDGHEIKVCRLAVVVGLNGAAGSPINYTLRTTFDSISTHRCSPCGAPTRRVPWPVNER